MKKKNKPTVTPCHARRIEPRRSALRVSNMLSQVEDLKKGRCGKKCLSCLHFFNSFNAVIDNGSDDDEQDENI